MPEQVLLFDELPLPAAVVPVGIEGSASVLSKAQKRFNKLTGQIATLRAELEAWQTFLPTHTRRCGEEFEPLCAQLRESQIEMARLLNAHMESGALGKTHQLKVRDLLLDLLDAILDGGEEPELVALYDHYADVPLADQHAEQAEMLRSVASGVFGLDLESLPPNASPEEIAAAVAAGLEQAETQEREQAAQTPRKPRKKNAKALAREAHKEQAQRDATRAVREVYRKLASELHPDREADPQERARKTTLMQRANQAYEKGDLLALLELQLQREQIDPQALARMADEQLGHYNHVLQEQVDRIKEEIDEVSAPFVLALGLEGHRRKLTIGMVRVGFEADLAALRETLEHLQNDLERLRDVKTLKRALRAL